MDDRTRGRQQPIQAEDQQQLAAVAEQHVLKPATPAHVRHWSAATAHDPRRYMCRSSCSTTIPPTMLGQLQRFVPVAPMMPGEFLTFRCVSLYYTSTWNNIPTTPNI